MRPIAAKSLKVIQYFKDHPDADVKKVAAKFGMALPKVYAIRKRAREESWQPPEMVPMPEVKAKRRITLNPSQVEIAKRLAAMKGVSLAEIVKQEIASGGLKYDDTASFPDESKNVDQILDTRATQYGTFKDGAELMQALKRTLANHAQKHDKTFADDQWEALEMIVHKIARIVNGNPDNIDSWADIAGYATLVADRLKGNAR